MHQPALTCTEPRNCRNFGYKTRMLDPVASASAEKTVAAPTSAHASRVAQIAADVRAAAAAKEPVYIWKGGVHHFVPLPGDKRFRGRRIDVSTLNHILSIDVVSRRCVAEPGVTFADLVRATLPLGLIPKVVPELEDITLGGAVAGCSVESMSYRYGGFHDGCSTYEVVTGAGEIRRLSSGEPLHEMIHGSYGTLAILTELTFDLVPALSYVHMTYKTLPSGEAFVAAMRAEVARADYDFIDAIVHSPTEHVLCLGRFVADVGARPLSSYRGVNIFYKSTRTLKEDWLTTFDYCFRYDTECHWLTRTVPPLEWKPVRALFGKWILGSRNLIGWSGRLSRILGLKKRPDVVVDVFIPAQRYLEFWNWYQADFSFYPLWIVPYRIPAPYPWISSAHAAAAADETLFIDCAVYGKPNAEPDVDWSERLEHKTYELGGIKTLISSNFHTRQRFWEIFNKPNYDAAKAELDPAQLFAPLYEKFHRPKK